MLYPLKFNEIFVEKIWAGKNLSKILHKNLPCDGVGESWEISGVEGHISQVADGALRGESLKKISQTYKDKLLGKKTWAKFADDFPLLIKYIDAGDYLSVQVHPDDNLAEKRYGTNGKNEMWYIVDAIPDAEIIVGFNGEMDRQRFAELAEQKELTPYLYRQKVKKGDAFFIPAGTVHAIGKGVLIAEIQQTSDVTYRIDDYGRVDANGKTRKLHVEEAVEAIRFDLPRPENLVARGKTEQVDFLFKSQYFSVNKINVRNKCRFDFSHRDCFTVFMCIEGDATLSTSQGSIDVTKGDTVLLPALFSEFELSSATGATLLEVFI